MKKTTAIILVGIISMFADSFACSAFLLKTGDQCIIGFNENWKSMPGIVAVNKRNVKKTSLSWEALTFPSTSQDKKITWVTKYGSVSFNLLGIDLPCYGVNEKGLFIVELFLDKTFSKPDPTKAEMFWAQWIQFQLDNYATVAEVLENLPNAPVIDWWPTFPGSHFYLADKLGNTAAIEQIDREFQVSSSSTMPIPVLCNEPYQKDLNQTRGYKFMSGDTRFNQNTTEWNDRFAKTTYLLNSYDPEISPVDYSWKVLNSIYPGEWQLVADLTNETLYFRSDEGTEIKELNLADCNFDDPSRIEYIDINSKLKGRVNNELKILTPDINDQYVDKGFVIGYVNDAFPGSDDHKNIRKNLRKHMNNLNQGVE